MKRKKNVIENLMTYEKQAEAKPSRKKKKSKSRKTSFEKQEKKEWLISGKNHRLHKQKYIIEDVHRI